MKGKGKGKEIHERDSCALQFPDFTVVDIPRMCPRISSVLGRKEDESVGIEDIDVIQLELETLLASVTKRMRLLQGEMQVLINHDKKDKKCTGKVQPEAPAKRGKSGDDKPLKKFKDNSGKSSHPSPIPPPRPGKNKNMQLKTGDHDAADSGDTSRKVPKNDAPNKFWSYVEPYCADVTPDNVKFLEELIAQHEDAAEYLKIPALGKHYSVKWAQEDMVDEQKEETKLDKKKGLTNGVNNHVDDDLVRNAEKDCDSDDNAPFGALTQRLVSCLIEENLMSSLDDIINDPAQKETDEGNSNGTDENFMKSFNVSNAAALEKRIRKELEEQGLLESDDVQDTDNAADDEILAELKKCQTELQAVRANNLNQTRKLLKFTKEASSKQELKSKLQVADAEVKDAYRKLQCIRQKKKTPTKKEKDHAWKALRERANIIKRLDDVSKQAQ